MPFQSTLPVGGATVIGWSSSLTISISIHAPRGGSDSFMVALDVEGMDFNPRSPWGERLCLHAFPLIADVFQSTLPVGGATLALQELCCLVNISIHAPRGGSDHRSAPRPDTPYDFNPRSPWGERPMHQIVPVSRFRFQSTLPVGGATTSFRQTKKSQSISIHAPRGGSDIDDFRECGGQKNFNPRSPWGERPWLRPPSRPGSCDFNPRSPWGERLVHGAVLVPLLRFQSTLPVGGATVVFSNWSLVVRFQSTLPVGGATGGGGGGGRRYGISIHAPRGGSDDVCTQAFHRGWHFNPRSPWGERQQRCTVLPAYLWRKGKF